MAKTRHWAAAGGGRLAASSVCLLLTASGCTLDTSDRSELRIATWWGGGEHPADEPPNSEARALTALTQSVPWMSLQPWKLDGQRQPIQGSYSNKQALSDDQGTLLPSEGESPVDALLLNGGQDPRAYGCDSDVVTAEVTRTDYQGVDRTLFVEGILEDTSLCENGDRLVAMPIGVHRLNTLFVNVDKLCAVLPERSFCDKSLSQEQRAQALQRDFDSFAAFTASLASLKSRAPAELRLVSLSKSANHTNDWVLSLAAFENVMVQYTSDALTFKRFWETEEATTPAADAQNQDATGPNAVASDDTALSEQECVGAVDANIVSRCTLNNLSTLAGYTSQCSQANEDPRCGIMDVARGQALFTIMGDWVSNDISAWTSHSAGLAPDWIAAIPFPGTAQKFVYSSDVLVIPKRPFGGSLTPALTLANAAISHAGQTKIAAVKGSRRVVKFSQDSYGVENPELDIPKNLALIPGLTHIVPKGKYNDLSSTASECFWQASAADGSAAVSRCEDLRKYVLRGIEHVNDRSINQ